MLPKTVGRRPRWRFAPASSNPSCLRAQHHGESLLYPPALVSGRRTIHRTLSRRPRLVDATELPEALCLDHAQESFYLAASNQSRRECLKPNGWLPHLGVVLRQKVTRHGDRDRRLITTLLLLQLECPPEVVERITIAPKSRQNAGKLLMTPRSRVVLRIGMG